MGGQAFERNKDSDKQLVAHPNKPNTMVTKKTAQQYTRRQNQGLVQHPTKPNKMVTKETARRQNQGLVQHPTKPNKMVQQLTARRLKDRRQKEAEHRYRAYMSTRLL
jgi:hypothetical protein